MMNSQTVINILIGLSGALGVWALNRLTANIDKLDHDIRKIQVEYVGKEDYFRDVREIKDMLKLIFDKLDHKQDKA
jgi:hypothetical protein